MGSSISKRFHRNKRGNAQGKGSSGTGRVRVAAGTDSKIPAKRFHRDGTTEVAKSNYNAYSIGLNEAKTEDVEDAILKDIMRTQLALDSQVFVLNQLLLGVQFFANYDVDIEQSKDRVRTEQNLKSEKIRHCNKSVMMTNELSDAIDQGVIFQMRHGPEKAVKRNLFNHKLYIVHDNVEICNEGTDNMTYSTMSYQPSYRLEFDKKYKKRSGYVRLRFCDQVRLNNPDIVEEVLSSDNLDSTETSNSSTSHTTSSLLYLGDDVTVIKERGIYNSSQASMSSEYDYTYMASFNEHRPLMPSSNYNFAGSRNGRITDPRVASLIPDECITEVKRMITVSTVDNESDSLPADNLEYKFQYMEQRGQYLNSKMFMNYFKRIFRDQISENLEIGNEQLMNATWKGASIYCPVQGSCGKAVNHYEIIPAIACPWPSEAIDWFHRKRILAANPTSPATTWMTEEMINRIFELNCHAIPIGYVSKKTQRANNFNRSLEWKIIFPDAERYLESRLNDCQLKVYIMAKILYKTYIEPLNIPMTSREASSMTMSLPDLTAVGTTTEENRSHFNFITDEHLRAHLFAQCELNTIQWSEFNLGGNLLEFLRTFLHRVQTKNLPDFFLPKRNLFEHVPENVITKLHESIFRILENPVMYVMRAMKNVRFVKNFYPKINMRRLYTILTIAEPLALVHPKLYSDRKGDSDEDIEEVAEKDPDLRYALGSMAEYHQQADKDPEKRRLTKQMKFQEMMKIKKMAGEKVVRTSLESEEFINTEVVVKDHMHKCRRKAIYDLFVRQYMEVAKKCLEFENHKFVPIYVRQARRLADLLREDHFEIDANELYRLIRELELLQKHPELQRSQSNARDKPRPVKAQPTNRPQPLTKFEAWKPPTSPDQVVSPMVFSPMSPPEARKSILKNNITNGSSSGDRRPGGSPKMTKATTSHHSTPHMSITVDIHHQKVDSNNSNAKPTSNGKPHSPTPTMAITLNRTMVVGDSGTDNGRDYKKITAIEMIDKSGSDHHRMTRFTSQLDGQDSHVSIL